MDRRALTLAGVLAIAVNPNNPQAATHTVCSGPCDFTSVHAAHAAAAPGDTIRLDYVGALTEQNIAIRKSLTIEGESAAVTWLQPSQFPFVGGGRVILVSAPNPDTPITVTLRGFTIRHGDSGAQAGGGLLIQQGATVHLEDMILTANNARLGGAMSIVGAATITRSELSLNSAELGGGIFQTSALSIPLIIRHSALTDNTAESGGAVYANEPLDIEDSTLEFNDASDFGGALLLTSSIGDMTRVQMNDNVARLDGGGITTLTGQVLRIRDSAIYGNSAGRDGGGLLNDSGVQISLTNVHIDNNSAERSGGAIYQRGGTLELAHTTIRSNLADANGNGEGNAGGVFLAEGTDSRIVSSILALNSDNGQEYPDCAGRFSSGNYSLISDSGPILGGLPCSVSGFTAGMLFDVPAGLAQIAGTGQLRTSPLAATSPAIDAGRCVDAAGVSLSADQRGAPMPVDGDSSGSAQCDMGAFEFLSSAPAEALVFRDGFEDGP